MHGDEPGAAVLEDRSRWTVPRELGVALVAEHRDAVGSPPPRRGREVVERPSRVARRVDPQTERPLGVVRVDGRQIEMKVGRRRRRERLGIRRARRPSHTSGSHGGIQHGVAIRSTEAQPLRQRPHELFRADAGGEGGRLGDAEPAGDPARSRRPAEPRCRSTAGSPARRQSEARASSTDGAGGSHGVPTERSTMPPSCASAIAAISSRRS